MLCSSFCHFAIYHHSFFAVFYQSQWATSPSFLLTYFSSTRSRQLKARRCLPPPLPPYLLLLFSAVVQIAVHRTHRLAPSLLSISSIGRRRKLVNVQCISFRLLLLRLCCLSTVEQQQQKSHLKGIILITTTILITIIITPNIIPSPCPSSSTPGPLPR